MGILSGFANSTPFTPSACVPVVNGSPSSSPDRRGCKSSLWFTKTRPLITSKGDGSTGGYIFRSDRLCRLPVDFKAIVPAAETFENPRYIRIEDEFSHQIAGGDIHDCRVVVDKKVFFITAYWKEDGNRNLAVESIGRGLRWKGEIAIVQVGKFKPFYRRLKDPSSANKAVARCVIPSHGISSCLTAFDSFQICYRAQSLHGVV